MSMFCYQCEQTSQGVGCTTMGICGKTPEVAVLQDVMVYITKGISQYANRARKLSSSNFEIDAKILEALFMTLTNVNFDCSEHFAYIRGMTETLVKSRDLYVQACLRSGRTPTELIGPAQWSCPDDDHEILAFGQSLSILSRLTVNRDLAGLQELLTYGIKGLAAYAHHALLLGYTDDKIFDYVEEALDYLTSPEQTIQELLSLALKAGEINLRVMEILDQAHTETYGHPEPTQARTTPVAGKAILVSGHDLKSLHEVLKATSGSGINVYTHGELLPALAYPALKAYPHLVGNFGTAWQNQVTEFAEFPGAILMTTNCLKPPAESYKERLFTMDVVGFEGITKIENYDFQSLIETALASPGFLQDDEQKSITIGFGRNSVISVADKVIEAVKQGKIRHFFLIGGCDGAEYSRNYFTDMAESVPKDCVILTLGCGKYRFNMQEFEDIDGIPRLLDVGQCNDAYSAIKIASALAEAFSCSINELPLSLVISWFEQKAVAVLL
ncbi:MAG: hydroxylamine reductase, partial [Cyanobacteria bacterium]|nr:hydroxylamine reductase [Cyanobacteriota bacterium]